MSVTSKNHHDIYSTISNRPERRWRKKTTHSQLYSNCTECVLNGRPLHAIVELADETMLYTFQDAEAISVSNFMFYSFIMFPTNKKTRARTTYSLSSNICSTDFCQNVIIATWYLAETNYFNLSTLTNCNESEISCPSTNYTHIRLVKATRKAFD